MGDERGSFVWCKVWEENLCIWGKRIVVPSGLGSHPATCTAYEQGMASNQSHWGTELHPDKWWTKSNFQKWFKVSGDFLMLSRITHGVGSEQWYSLGDMGKSGRAGHAGGYCLKVGPRTFPLAGPSLGKSWKGEGVGSVAFSSRIMVPLLHGWSESWWLPSFSIHVLKRRAKTQIKFRRVITNDWLYR